MPADPHPYQHLPPSGFWRSGVAQRGVPHFEQLWTPRFPMPRGTRFATAGSCFAQHISAWLRRHGHSWLDSEPAPAGLNEHERADGGWGVFSFRTGNIYTAELFLQWVRWAIGVDAPVNEAVEHDGAWYDPFRPQIPRRGLPSAEAVFEARAHTLQRMRQALLQTDVSDPDVGGVVADKLIQVLSEPFELEGGLVSVGASIGISVYPDDAEHGEQLLRNADRALYAGGRPRSRGRGGNCARRCAGRGRGRVRA